MNRNISIAMTTYNGERYLREQLDSIYAQTLAPDEVIVVDDCSTDNTQNILKEYQQLYGLKYYINERNLGVNKNFEKAISLCSGGYIALSDQDDVWMPYKLERSYQKLFTISSSVPALVSSARIDVDEQLRSVTGSHPVPDSDSFLTTLLGHNSQGCSMMFNRALARKIIPIPPDKEIMFDLYIGLTAAMTGYKYYIGEPLFYYRHHSANVYARFKSENPSFFKKMRERSVNRFPKLFKEERFGNMKAVALRQSENFIPERRSIFFKLLSLNENKAYIRKLGTILSLKEIPFYKRCLIVCDTMISNVFRFCFL
ncbi:MAG: glycosyltransferase family 2 protein [Dysgonamonadaceae bacterium]|nr:glycosyltransferase family 2 protein [Dysgonamonadaceae bacterium]